MVGYYVAYDGEAETCSGFFPGKVRLEEARLVLRGYADSRVAYLHAHYVQFPVVEGFDLDRAGTLYRGRGVIHEIYQNPFYLVPVYLKKRKRRVRDRFENYVLVAGAVKGHGLGDNGVQVVHARVYGGHPRETRKLVYEDLEFVHLIYDCPRALVEGRPVVVLQFPDILFPEPLRRELYGSERILYLVGYAFRDLFPREHPLGLYEMRYVVHDRHHSEILVVFVAYGGEIDQHCRNPVFQIHVHLALEAFQLELRHLAAHVGEERHVGRHEGFRVKPSLGAVVSDGKHLLRHPVKGRYDAVLVHGHDSGGNIA